MFNFRLNSNVLVYRPSGFGLGELVLWLYFRK